MCALEFFGGCTELWVPDNLRSGVSKALRYEPDVSTYYELAPLWRGGAVVPRRQCKGQIQQRERRAGGRTLGAGAPAILQSQQTQPVGAHAVRRPLDQRPFRKLAGSCASAFAEMDQIAPCPLRKAASSTPNGGWHATASTNAAKALWKRVELLLAISDAIPELDNDDCPPAPNSVRCKL